MQLRPLLSSIEYLLMFWGGKSPYELFHRKGSFTQSFESIWMPLLCHKHKRVTLTLKRVIIYITLLQVPFLLVRMFLLENLFFPFKHPKKHLLLFCKSTL